ncbi:MAG: hypothetical protein IT184_12395 [Acidobacteria bacterium]|nr:hypothetical protein [Acidobacteriota bacterium]
MSMTASMATTVHNWIGAANAVYRGDCDEAGYGIPSNLRASFPRLRSLLMDLDSWQRWKHWATPGRRHTSARHDKLFPAERAAFGEMLKGPFMLAQERISPVAAADAIGKAVQ